MAPRTKESQTPNWNGQTRQDKADTSTKRWCTHQAQRETAPASKMRVADETPPIGARLSAQKGSGTHLHKAVTSKPGLAARCLKIGNIDVSAVLSVVLWMDLPTPSAVRGAAGFVLLVLVLVLVLVPHPQETA